MPPGPISISVSASASPGSRSRSRACRSEGHWQAVARGTVRDNLYALQRKITGAVLQVQGPRRGRAGRSMDRAPRGCGRVAEADRGRFAHRRGAGFRDAVRRPAGRADGWRRNERARCNARDRSSARTICSVGSIRIPARAAHRHRGRVAPTTPAWCLRRRSRPTPITRARPSAEACFRSRCLTGWAWVTRYLATRQTRRRRGDPGIDDPLSWRRCMATLRATLAAPPAARRSRKFDKMLRRAGRGRIRLHVDMHHGQVLATRFEGVFAAPRVR